MILKEHTELQRLLVERLVAAYHPQAIYLFGSQAWGTPTTESDIDLYVILKDSTQSLAERIYHGTRAILDLKIAVDLLVFTESEIRERSQHPMTLEHKILAQGIKLYAAA